MFRINVPVLFKVVTHVYKIGPWLAWVVRVSTRDIARGGAVGCILSIAYVLNSKPTLNGLISVRGIYVSHNIRWHHLCGIEIAWSGIVVLLTDIIDDAAK